MVHMVVIGSPFSIWARFPNHLVSSTLAYNAVPFLVRMPRGEIPDDEDIANLSPVSLLARTPDLAFLALLAILDPPREEVIEAVKEAHTAGICVKMITGGWVESGGSAVGRLHERLLSRMSMSCSPTCLDHSLELSPQGTMRSLAWPSGRC